MTRVAAGFLNRLKEREEDGPVMERTYGVKFVDIIEDIKSKLSSGQEKDTVRSGEAVPSV